MEATQRVFVCHCVRCPGLRSTVLVRVTGLESRGAQQQPDAYEHPAQLSRQ